MNASVPNAKDGVPDYWYSLIGVLVLVVTSISTIGNIGIIVLYKSVFKRHKSRLLNVNLISLTVSDIGICLSFPIVIDACFNKGWRAGAVVCHLVAHSDAIFAYSQIYNLACIAIERFVVANRSLISHPSIKAKIVSISTVWVLAIIMGSLPWFGFGDFMRDGIYVSCSFDYKSQTAKNQIYVVFITVFGFILPVISIVWSYVKIVGIYRLSASTFISSLPDDHSQHLMRRREFLLLKSATNAVVCFVLAWTPYAIIALCAVFGAPSDPVLETLASIFAKCSSATNAIVYICNHPEFKEFKQNRQPTSAEADLDQNRNLALKEVN